MRFIAGKGVAFFWVSETLGVVTALAGGAVLLGERTAGRGLDAPAKSLLFLLLLALIAGVFALSHRRLGRAERFRSGGRDMRGTERALADGRILEGGILVGKKSVVGRLAMIAPGVAIGRAVVIGVGTSVGTGTMIEDGVSIGPTSTIKHGVRIGKGAVIGAGTYIASGAVIDRGARVPAGSVILTGVHVRSADELQAPRAKTVSEHSRLLARAS